MICIFFVFSAEGETPLSAAAKNGRSKMLHYLLHKCQLGDTPAKVAAALASFIIILAE